MRRGRQRGLAVAAAVVLTAAVAVGARATFGVLVVDGGSMRPALEPADLLVVQRHPGLVSPGDIVVVPHAGWPAGIAHRVTALAGGGLLSLKGDANPVPDRDPVPVGDVLGRVIMQVPTGRLARAVAVRLGRW